MKKLFGGKIFSSACIGIFLALVGAAAAQFFVSPGVTLGISLAILVAGTLSAALVLDKFGEKNLPEKDPLRAPDQNHSFIRLEDCEDVEIINNSVPKGSRLLSAIRSKDIHAEGNVERD